MSDAAELKALVKKLQGSSQDLVRLTSHVNPVTFAHFFTFLGLGCYIYIDHSEKQF